MRYCMTLYLKGHRKYDRLKLKLLNLLNKNQTFNFTTLYFRCPLRYKVIQYLIWKLSYVVIWSQEGYVVEVLLSFVMSSWKPPFYYIKRFLSNLILTGLYIVLWLIIHSFRSPFYTEKKLDSLHLHFTNKYTLSR